MSADGKVRSEADFIFYNQLKSACGSVQHTGDNLTGAGEGDDEVIMVGPTTRAGGRTEDRLYRHHHPRGRTAPTEFSARSATPTSAWSTPTPTAK